MLYSENEISHHLENLGLQRTDDVFIHADAGVTAQYVYACEKNQIFGFIKHLFEFFDAGTVIMPAFTYSATSGKVFSLRLRHLLVKFSVGLKEFQRSLDPIFSVCAKGVRQEYYTHVDLKDCFGENSIFQKLHKNNVKILTLGCPLIKEEHLPIMLNSVIVFAF